MKQQAKKWLQGAGLLAPSRRLYRNLRTADVQTLRREIRFRRHGLPDGLPLPPPSLIFDVIGSRWTAVYYDSGALITSDLQTQLEQVGRPLQGFSAILDFGCGCGRMIRHVHGRTHARLYGSDYNPRLVAWCQAHLPFGAFRANRLHPPLSFEAGAFDLVYARSVFTHLTSDLQRAWVQEFRRVLQPGGVLCFTTHGALLAANLDVSQRAAFDRGAFVATFPEAEGKNRCSVYESPAFVAEHLTDGFKVLGVVEGRDQEHLRQDLHLLEKR